MSREPRQRTLIEITDPPSNGSGCSVLMADTTAAERREFADRAAAAGRAVRYTPVDSTPSRCQ